MIDTTNPEYCPAAAELDPDYDPAHDHLPVHCPHWYDCEPCHWCGDDTPDPFCDCDRCTAVRLAGLDNPTTGVIDSPS